MEDGKYYVTDAQKAASERLLGRQRHQSGCHAEHRQCERKGTWSSGDTPDDDD